jgi:hypothetical protein
MQYLVAITPNAAFGASRCLAPAELLESLGASRLSEP